MGKGKLAKFAEMARMEHVFEFPIRYRRGGENVENIENIDNVEKIEDIEDIEGIEGLENVPRGRWHAEVFHNDNPIVLELGCGRGEYTVGLARMHPDMNFIGVDIKGARMWTGARQAEDEGLRNVAFLRTNIEFIDRFFAAGEVDGIWLTFSDPQMKKVTKRLTSTYFLARYRRFVKEGGTVHLKTDSNFLFTYTEEMLKANGIEAKVSTRDLYNLTPGPSPQGRGAEDIVSEARSIQTYYETMWMGRGIPIKYLAFALTAAPAALVEPDVEIPLDEYRSYSREKRSGAEKHV